MDLKAAAEGAKALGDAALLPVSDKTELHVDGDYAAYYFSGNDETSFGEARANMVNALQTVRRVAGAGGRSVIHLTAPGSHKGHRFAIATVKPYQGQRDSSRRPKNWQAMREWLEGAAGGKIADAFGVKVWDDREADDGVALSAKYAFTVGHLPAIFSRDKDFRMIPGRHVSWTTYGITEVRPETWSVTDEDGLVFGAKWFWLQMLSGDDADYIPGLPKQPTEKGKFKNCGPVCAEEWLANSQTPEDAYAIVKSLYQAYYNEAWAAAFAEQAALLWLRTDKDANVGDFMRAVPAKSPELEQAVKALQRRLR